MMIQAKILKQTALSSLAGILLYILNASFVTWLFAAYPETQALVFGKGTWWLAAPPVIKLVYVGLISPVIEETIFRYGILGYFTKNNHQSVGLAISTILFALYHLIFGWGYLKPVLMLLPGMVFGILYIRFGFKGCLSCHLSNNILAAITLANA